MGEVFLISAKQVKAGRKQIKREIAGGGEKSFLILAEETFDVDGVDTGVKKKGDSGHSGRPGRGGRPEGETAGYGLGRIVNPRSGGGDKSLLVGSYGNIPGLAKKLLADEFHDIA